jgi:hypothetical protein
MQSGVEDFAILWRRRPRKRWGTEAPFARGQVGDGAAFAIPLEVSGEVQARELLTARACNR